MAVILDFCPRQIAKDKRIAKQTAKKLGQVIIFPGVRIERNGGTPLIYGDVWLGDKPAAED